MVADVNDPGDGPVPPLPPMNRTRNVAWGLAAFGLAFFPYFCAVAIGNHVFEMLAAAGRVPRAVPPGWGGVPEPYHLLVVVPAVLAGVVVGLRCRWRTGPALGAGLGQAAGAALYAANPYGLLGGPHSLPPCWLTTGLFGGALSAVRRRYGA